MYVLDATAFRSGMAIDGSHKWFTTPSVVGELEKGRVAKDLELRENIHLEILNPKSDYLAWVNSVAEETGDATRLSQTDLDVLALALELEATIITDDYSVQNVAEVLKINYQGGTESGIKEVFNWTFRCKGCGRTYEEELDSCLVCGSGIKTVRKK